MKNKILLMILAVGVVFSINACKEDPPPPTNNDGNGNGTDTTGNGGGGDSSADTAYFSLGKKEYIIELNHSLSEVYFNEFDTITVFQMYGTDEDGEDISVEGFFKGGQETESKILMDEDGDGTRMGLTVNLKGGQKYTHKIGETDYTFNISKYGDVGEYMHISFSAVDLYQGISGVDVEYGVLKFKRSANQ